MKDLPISHMGYMCYILAYLYIKRAIRNVVLSKRYAYNSWTCKGIGKQKIFKYICLLDCIF